MLAHSANAGGATVKSNLKMQTENPMLAIPRAQLDKEVFLKITEQDITAAFLHKASRLIYDRYYKDKILLRLVENDAGLP